LIIEQNPLGVIDVFSLIMGQLEQAAKGKTPVIAEDN
jgi:hypothetical protein